MFARRAPAAKATGYEYEASLRRLGLGSNRQIPESTVRGPFTQLYLHCVWVTWDRLPLITPDVEQQIYAAIVTKCKELSCYVLAIGGVEDHIHLLVRFPPTLAVATMVGKVKGVSSHLMTHQLNPDAFFRWQGAYGAFTVQKDVVEALTTYIKKQKAHHADNTLIPDWEIYEDVDESLRG